ncbi:Zinc finger, CCHC-type [Corchorus capsularis]|uniref:Zinc finger, CCHC-type n=1 Tax=Corchorus capsularis TaxID=210143 RepID=A0A1R3HCB9_COCAP|nr:Zinc finger, CCHC-type [Corchorus capsularis]
MSTIEKLNGSNYNTWSTRIQFYLLGQDLWEVVGGHSTTPPTEVEALRQWEIKAGKALYVLSVTIEEGLLYRIKDANAPKEAWDTLATLLARSNDAKQQQLKNELLSTSQQNTRPQQGGAQHDRDGNNNEERRYRRQNYQCYNCGKVDHFARDCRFKQAQGNVATTSRGEDDHGEIAVACTVEPEEEAALSMVSKINYNDDWIVDLGCSNHMTGDKEKLSNASTYAGKNNSRLPITHIGRTKIAPRTSQHQVQLDNVFHVSGMKKNLLSIAQLTDSGNYVVFGPKTVKVYSSIKPTSPLIMV